MNRRLQLVLIICVVVSVTAIVSHSLISWLKIETTFGRHWVLGRETYAVPVFMAGSSLAGDGLSWKVIGDALDLRIEGWGVAGSSPSEWEHFQHQTTHTKLMVIVVSAYDLNEYFLSDFRAEIAPLGQTIRDLWQSRADWPLCKRLLSLYPLTYLRMLFPTAGRSDGVMVGVRERIKNALRTFSPIETEAGPTLSLNESANTPGYKKERISEWDSGRTLRRLSNMRSASQGKHRFNGPKKLAFLRMLLQAQKQGQVVVVVLPVSPYYAGEFLTADVKQEFEEVMVEEQRAVQQACWIRLDQLDALNSNDYFWDLVHMNIYGQQIATEAFISHVRKVSKLL